MQLYNVTYFIPRDKRSENFLIFQVYRDIAIALTSYGNSIELRIIKVTSLYRKPFCLSQIVKVKTWKNHVLYVPIQSYILV